MTPQSANTKWVWVAVIAVALFLLWAVFRGCAPDNQHKGNKAGKDSIVKVETERNRFDSLVILEYKDAITALSKENVVLKRKTEALELQLSKSSNKASRISYEVVKAKIVHDTVMYVQSCDSLVTAVADLANILDNYQEEIHDLTSSYEAQLLYKDSVIAIQTRGRAELMKSFGEISVKYDGLYKDYSKAVKRGKRERGLNRALAVGLLVAGGMVLAK